MNKLFEWFYGVSGILIIVLTFACQQGPQSAKVEGLSELQTHYVEIVSDSVAAQCSILEQVHGLSFGPENQDLGQARVAKTANGTLIGVRAPLAAHEQPIVRVYFVVDDINAAVKAAETAGAIIAYPPTKQGDTGTWAIYFKDGIQYGLWQK